MVETNTWQTWTIPDLDDSKEKSVAEPAEKDLSTSEIELSEHEAIEDVEDWGEETEESVEEVDSKQVQLPSAEELEELRKKVELEAYNEGFEKGRSHGEESGRQQAYEHAKQEISTAVSQLNQIANTLINPLEGQDQAIETIMLNSVVTIAKSIIHKELTTQPDQILAIVKQAIDALPQGEKQTKITIHTDDAKFVQQHIDEDNAFVICTNDELSPGGCKVETVDSVVDATVESRLQLAIDQFLGKELSTGEAVEVESVACTPSEKPLEPSDNDD